VSRIVGVHGIAQEQFGRRQLLRDWSAALNDGIEAAIGRQPAEEHLDIGFYGDLFLDGGPVRSISAKGAGGAFVPPSEPDLDFLESAAQEIFSPQVLAEEPETKGPPGLPPRLLRVVAAFDRHLDQRAGRLFVGVLQQVRRYLTEPDLQAAVHTRLVAAMTEQTRVLVAHSLGSVVALEHLRRHPGIRVDHLVTIGSPLALRAIRDLLANPDFGTGSTGPPNVGRWVNLRDPRDPVALAGGLGRYWPTVIDDDTVRNGRAPHAATHYLGKRQTGNAVLGRDPGDMS
jgi:hypothetical protein